MRSRDNGSAVRRLILCGVLTAVALGLSLIDSSISAVFAFVPGFKIGLANIVSLFALYYMGLPSALAICVARCFLGAVFAGQVTMFLFSILGGVGSLLVMWMLRGRIRIVKVSTIGGVVHNMMQLVAAGIVTGTSYLVHYMPILVILGTVTGFCLGIICELLFLRIRGINSKLALRDAKL